MNRRLESLQLSPSDYRNLLTAVASPVYDRECHLDVQTGDVHWFSPFQLEYDAVPDAEDPEWVHDVYKDRLRIWRDDSGRFLEVPNHSYQALMRDMKDFLDEVSDGNLCDRLRSAVYDRDEKRFEAILSEDGESTKRQWRDYRKERVRSRVNDWLRRQGYLLNIGDKSFEQQRAD